MLSFQCDFGFIHLCHQDRVTVLKQALSDHFLDAVISLHKSASAAFTLFTRTFMLAFANLVFVLATCDLNLLIALSKLAQGLNSTRAYFDSFASLFFIL